MRISNAKSKRMAGKGAHNGVAELRTQAETIGRDVRELATTAGQLALGQMDPIERYVRERPVKSLLIAAGAGALLGLLFSRR
jgi:ElaB/YqjD/DUF883 family membrane-anchored ribosome-binding protein